MTDLFPKQELIATMRCQPGALLPCKLDWPIEKICYWSGRPSDLRPAAAPLWHDGWGVGWQKESADPQMMPFPIEHPLDGRIAKVGSYSPPSATDPRLFADLRHLRHAPERLLIGEHPFALFERAWLVTGMQHLLESMTETPELVDELFSRIGAFELEIARAYLNLGVEAAWISDDYGMNSAMMFSPTHWRRFVRPHLQRLVDEYHAAGALVILHSCGNITGLVDDFVEIGIDVLDPLQPNCNRLGYIRERTAGRICLSGGVQASAMAGNDAVRTAADTRERIQQLGADGGYIVGPDDEWELPEAAHAAMLNTVEQHRDAARRDRA